MKNKDVSFLLANDENSVRDVSRETTWDEIQSSLWSQHSMTYEMQSITFNRVINEITRDINEVVANFHFENLMWTEAHAMRHQIENVLNKYKNMGSIYDFNMRIQENLFTAFNSNMLILRITIRPTLHVPPVSFEVRFQI